MSFKFNSTGIDPDAKNFTPAPEGDYWLIIRETTTESDYGPFVTKNGDQYVKVMCEIDEGPMLGKMVWHNVIFMAAGKPGAGMAVKFLKTIGEPWEGDLDINPALWVGKRFQAKLKISEYKGNKKNEIAYLLTEKAPASAAANDDEVPF